MAPAHGQLIVRGARQHNLKSIDVTIPRGELVVITGVSGSGKSSLAFDTIYAEGQRRYVESLSAYARQFLEQLDKPDVDEIEGLSPAIAIQQRGVARNPRSTVGTVTEIHDHLRVLFARAGQAHCWECAQPIRRQSAAQMAARVLAGPRGARVDLLAPVVRGRKGALDARLLQLQRDGYRRVRIDGSICRIEEAPAVDGRRAHTLEVCVDRLRLREGLQGRARDSVEACLRLSEGLLLLVPEHGPEELLSEELACPDCGVSLPELEPRTFSFNSPHGACPGCEGLGVSTAVDPSLVVPDPALSVRAGAIHPWADTSSEYIDQVLETVSAGLGFSLDTPWQELPEQVRTTLLHGSGERSFHFDLKGRRGQGHSFTRPFEGVVEQMARRYRQTDSPLSREETERYMHQSRCETCGGGRLRTEALHVHLGGVNIATLSGWPVAEAARWIEALALPPAEATIATRLLREIRQRLGFLEAVGLGYLSLDRAAASLSGGEAQRIRLATQIGSSLVGVLYVLDEPSIGLHSRDNARLLDTLRRLRDRGNTVLVVEHDEDTVRAADHVVDLGPGAGQQGGEIVGQGTAAQLMEQPASLTGQYLAGRRRIEVPGTRRDAERGCLRLLGARHNNLQGVDLELPLGRLVAVTGVSGSGKSSLIIDTLYRALAQALHRAGGAVGAHVALQGLELVDGVIDIDQSPIGRTPRSNPATYTQLFEPIRRLYAGVPEARARGFKPGRFSFNVKGGRCETCRGGGTIKVEMHFLPDVYVRCGDCQGLRFGRDTLAIRYKGASVADVLGFTVAQAAEFFAAQPKLRRTLALLEEVGLGYLQLGQPATTLSGGEAQRIKISRELARRSTGRTVYVLDEPTTGLHVDDINRLLAVLQRLVEAGNTVVVIEHNLHVIKCADWVIDLGPEGGAAGGQIIAAGTPEQIAAHPGSHTGRYLAPLLGSA